MNPKEQGPNAPKIFHGETVSEAAFQMYAESANLFADIIKKSIPVGDECSMVDLGSHKGIFLKDLLGELPEYRFHTIAVDINGEDLADNPADEKINSDLSHVNIPDKSVDIVVCRYVLAWNSLEVQKEIISEMKRIGSGLGIIQHQGAESENPVPLQNAAQNLFSGVVPKLKREDFFFSTPNQVEEILAGQEIQFERIQNRVVFGLSDLLIEKYGLSEQDAEVVKNILKDTDYVNQTTWVLKF